MLFPFCFGEDFVRRLRLWTYLPCAGLEKVSDERLKIFETCSWMKQYSKNISLEILDKPEIFSEASVPMHERQKYILELKKLRKFPIGMYSAGKFRSNINYLIQRYTKTKYNKQLHKTLKAEIAEQDSHRSINLKQTDAFLYNWIYE